MTETGRTLGYALAAAGSLLLAWIAAPGAPREPAEFREVGQEFYPEFTDASTAKALQVSAFDSDKAAAAIFAVEQKDGQWRIPSRHNYPADGKDRLAKAAASLLGVKRESLASKYATDHAKFNVLDPLDDKSTALDGRGQRLTIKKGDGSVLADYIIGKAVESRSGMFYLRKPTEDATYMAKLDINLSTKFSEWIEPDLLKIEQSRLKQVSIDKLSIDEGRGEIVGFEQSILEKKSVSEGWTLKDLDAATEEMNKEEVDKLVRALDDLKIEGIRPKPARLREGLRLSEGLSLDQLGAIDLQNKGFFLVQEKGGGRQLLGKEGGARVITDQGVLYNLYFGDVFTGSVEEIELGAAASSEAKPAEGDAAADKPGLRKSRYLFVSVEFDSEGLGTEPLKPTAPERPEGYDPVAAPPAGDDETVVTATDVDNNDTKLKYRAFEAAQSAYDTAMRTYESDLKAWTEKVKDGEKRVKELNQRFADWYYVISAENFGNLRQGRKTLVKAKAAGAETGGGALPGGLSPNE